MSMIMILDIITISIMTAAFREGGQLNLPTLANRISSNWKHVDQELDLNNIIYRTSIHVITFLRVMGT